MRSRTRHRAGAPLEGRRGVETLIARVLFWGGALSIILVSSGLVLYAARGGFHGHWIELHRPPYAGRHIHPREVFVSISEVARGLEAHPVRPTAIIALGLTLLLMTPVLGVAVAIPGFLMERDFRYATIATIVLVLLVSGMLLAGGIV
jgi:uncharacterized membrane protein